MNVRSEQLDSHVVTLVTTIEPSDYREEYAAKLKESRKSLNLKGFRPGQVPMGLAERMIGPRIRLDVVQKKLDQAVSGYLQENNLKTYSHFLPNENQESQDIESGEGTFTFRMDVGVMPALPDALLPKVVVFEPQVDEAYVHSKLEVQRKLHGKERELEQVEAGCLLRLHFAPQDSVGEEGKHVERRVGYDDLGADMQAQLLGKRVGDALDVATLEGFVADAELHANVFRVLPQDAFPLGGPVRIRLAAVLKHELAELDTAFYRTLVTLRDGEEEPSDLEGWSALYRSRQQEWCEYEARMAASDSFLRGVVDAWDFEIPASFVRRMVENQEGGAKEELSDATLAYYQRQLKEESARADLASRLDWEELGMKLSNDGYIRFLAAVAIRDRGMSMGFPPYFYDSVERALSFGYSIYADKIEEIIAPVQKLYAVLWETIQSVGYDARPVPIQEYAEAIKAEYGVADAE